MSRGPPEPRTGFCPPSSMVTQPQPYPAPTEGSFAPEPPLGPPKGLAKLGWLRTLKTSTRNCARKRSLKVKAKSSGSVRSGRDLICSWSLCQSRRAGTNTANANGNGHNGRLILVGPSFFTLLLRTLKSVICFINLILLHGVDECVPVIPLFSSLLVARS